MMDRKGASADNCPRVVVAFNSVGPDEFEALRQVDPSTLPFQPRYKIHVKTALEEYQALVDALRQEGYDASLFNLEDDIPRLQTLVASPAPDVIFNLVEGIRNQPGLESAAAATYELHGIPFTGASAFSLSLCWRKGYTKQLLRAIGVPTPPYLLLYEPKLPRPLRLRYPLIAKPAREDASIGVEKTSVLYRRAELEQRVDYLFRVHRPPILVEEYIHGRELHVSVLGNSPPEALPVLEYDFSDLPSEHPPILTHAVKWNPLDESYHQVHEVCPANLPENIDRRAREIAVKAYGVTECRDYARIDLRLTPDGSIYVLEVNPNPDLTEGVSFMRSAEQAGRSFSETLRTIVELARCRAVPDPPVGSVVR